jgi:hypothetical protein
MCQKIIKTHFLNPEQKKKRFGWSSLSDVLTSWKTLRTHIFLLDVFKNVFAEVNETIFQGVERPYDLNFWILRIEKRDLDEVA